MTTEKRAWRTHYCSVECKAGFYVEAKTKRDNATRRQCLTCGVTFYKRNSKSVIGKYCGIRCGVMARIQEFCAQGAAKKKALLADGLISYPAGPTNKQWKGGPRATLQRSKESGALLRSIRKYRAAHPEKVREWNQTRNGRKIGRLPRGTIPGLFAKQKGRCAVCRARLVKSYHVDHIMPLARGGAHETANIQLLCAHCNCTKNAKHPLDFMQERGFLL